MSACGKVGQDFLRGVLVQPASTHWQHSKHIVALISLFTPCRFQGPQLDQTDSVLGDIDGEPGFGLGCHFQYPAVRPQPLRTEFSDPVGKDRDGVWRIGGPVDQHLVFADCVDRLAAAKRKAIDPWSR